MSTLVGHTYGGNVVVVDTTTNARFDLSPEQARVAAGQCEALVNAIGQNSVIIKALEDSEFSYGGIGKDMKAMAEDLRGQADLAEAIVSTRH